MTHPDGNLAHLKNLIDDPPSFVDDVNENKINDDFLTDENAFVFINNHDNQRGHGGAGDIIDFHTPQKLTVATAYMMALPYGTKRIMSSYEFENKDVGPPDMQPS